ncbi:MULTISPECIES: M28 family peptidase [Chryseobacterium]|uniref:M28 family peptidase n=1 Tax=Chryseobacterium bernardetii TaxID=1241978 RepID=A0A3G6TE90_9FLAO|nr:MULTISPECIES: M28 family peptidase [Chryseobacterium]AZB26287.1 M28 family peptidase [Chryseobacterium bernardetii]AZB32791.1 M28 family peptidase [Chryseobacterium bernardetii]UCA60547.1 M28 family peptidase [Chryseobacterium rhizoplanae]
MKRITTLLCASLIAQSISAQTFIQAYKDRADMVTQTNITANLQEFGNLGIKKTGSQANVNTLNWIKNKYLSYGYTASQITESPFTYGSVTSKNLIITKTGTLYPNKYVIICGHFDTIYGPGVNDNGSGTSIILEAARILQNVPTEYSIKFIHFSGEEQGLIGSSHYVNNVVYQNGIRKLDIKLVFNLDQVGGVKGNNNNTVYCDEDQGGLSGNNAASAAVTQQLRNCTALYSPLQTAVDPAEDTDYIPFEQKGEIITGFFERIRSTFPHSSKDTFANVDPVYVYNIGKATVGALQHFATASTTLAVNKSASPNALENVKLYPNPANNILHVELPDKTASFSFEITNISGRTLLKVNNETEINVSALERGVYVGILKAGDQTVVKNILIER